MSYLFIVYIEYEAGSRLVVGKGIILGGGFIVLLCFEAGPMNVMNVNARYTSIHERRVWRRTTVVNPVAAPMS